jgi:hypothetical protein
VRVYKVGAVVTEIDLTQFTDSISYDAGTHQIAG